MKHLFTLPVCIIAILLLHSMARYQMASLFLAPATLAILFATALPIPTVLLGVIALLFEVFSSIPQSGMLLIFLIPFATRRVRPWSVPDITWKFFAYVVGTVALQLLTLVVIQQMGISIQVSTIPFFILLLQLIATSGSTFIFSLICHEIRNRP